MAAGVPKEAQPHYGALARGKAPVRVTRMVKLADKAGNIVMVHSVDAREALATGLYHIVDNGGGAPIAPKLATAAAPQPEPEAESEAEPAPTRKVKAKDK